MHVCMYVCNYVYMYVCTMYVCILLYLSISIELLTARVFQKRSRPQQLILCRSLHAEALQATASEGLAQGPYVAAGAGFEPATIRSKGTTLQCATTHHNVRMYVCFYKMGLLRLDWMIRPGGRLRGQPVHSPIWLLLQMSRRVPCSSGQDATAQEHIRQHNHITCPS